MAKIIVAIDVPGSVASIKNERDWFPHDSEHISIDEAYLKRDPDEDSFFEFELVELREDT